MIMLMSIIAAVLASQDKLTIAELKAAQTLLELQARH